MAALLFVLSCGDDGPTDPVTADLEVLAVQGDGQAALPGTLLPTPLVVRVQSRGNGSPEEGVKVRWEVVSGAGSTLDVGVSETNSLGLAEARLTLGPSIGTSLVEASLQNVDSPPALFTAEAIPIPVLSMVPSDPVQGGDIILLRGSNFSADLDRNLVTFSGVRGRVVAADPVELRVEVPACLLSREYQVQVRIGALSSEAIGLGVTGSPESLNLARGEDRVLDASEGLECFHLPGEDGSLFLVVPHSTGTVDGSGHQYSLRGLTSDGISPAPFSPSPARNGWRAFAQVPEASGAGLEGNQAAALEAQRQWDEKLRIREKKLLSRLAPLTIPDGPEPSGEKAASRIPGLGDKRTFNVLNREEGFDRVSARLQLISEHSLVYVDEEAPSGGFTEEDLAALSMEFEDPVYPTVTGAFGQVSDVDKNSRVIILFSPAVNRLTEPGSEGFVGGFFYGLDLLADREGSNGSEIFYAMVPDPSGGDGPVISRQTALATIPAILAHEFEHMVHFNQRMLLGEAESTEALWLAEALAQMAEDLVGDAFEAALNPQKAYQYRSGNWMRARRFLLNPSQVSVLASLSPGTLAQRGAGWLFLKQVSGRAGQEGLLQALVSSTRTGTENIIGETGLGWNILVADWTGSLFLDGLSVPVRSGLRVAGVNLRAVLSEATGSYPLRASPFGGSSEVFSGTLWPSAPNYFIISPPAGDGVAVSAGGVSGGEPEAALGLQILVVRLQ